MYSEDRTVTQPWSIFMIYQMGTLPYVRIRCVCAQAYMCTLDFRGIHTPHMVLSKSNGETRLIFRAFHVIDPELAILKIFDFAGTLPFGGRYQRR